ncbi:MAG: xanthine dehydrogenase family protein subunit M [Acidimicrobiia bacterium]|nr:MAG: xanthine dehydrogenase family protein subunit M [Acidimicrobiia bacterium]
MIRAYHRPTTLTDALSLLESDGTAVLSGGTSLIPSGVATVVVDLQDLDLDTIEIDGDRIAIGAMARLSDLVESDLVPPILRDLARREAPNTIRNAATLAGTIATRDPESELVAGLLVHDTAVTIATSDGPQTVALPDYLVTPHPGIITGVTIEGGGAAAAERTGRTPADRPIVMAVARRTDDGAMLLALTGVAAFPVLADAGTLPTIDPPGDFRGTSNYRRHLAETLAARVIAAVGESS